MGRERYHFVTLDVLAAGIDPRNFTTNELNIAIATANSLAGGDQGTFTTSLVNEIVSNIAPNSPIRPAYVVVRETMLCHCIS